MDTRDLSFRLHDILRAANRIRLPGPGCTAEASVESINAVKSGVRELLAGLADQEPTRLPRRAKASAEALPEGRIPGTRILVQHRRRGRVGADAVGQPGRAEKPTPREAAERLFRPAIAAAGISGGEAGPAHW